MTARDEARACWRLVASGCIDANTLDWLVNVARRLTAIDDAEAGGRIYEDDRRKWIPRALGLYGKRGADVKPIERPARKLDGESTRHQGRNMWRAIADGLPLLAIRRPEDVNALKWASARASLILLADDEPLASRRVSALVEAASLRGGFNARAQALADLIQGEGRDVHRVRVVAKRAFMPGEWEEVGLDDRGEEAGLSDNAARGRITRALRGRKPTF